MSMNGIDIASYQAGIDLASVPCDFAIIKATEGISYVNPDCDRAFQSGEDAGKKLGIYHFASGGISGTDEADFFINNVLGYIGKAIPVLDWEANAINYGPEYALEFMRRVLERTGVKPLIYMSGSVVTGQDWAQAVAEDYGLWVAAYYTDYIEGYNADAPMYDIAYWPGAAMLQYTSGGHLPGWGGALDLDVFYGDAAAWDAYAGSKPAVQEDTQPPTGDKPFTDRPICNEQHFGVWVRNVRDNIGLGSVKAAVWSVDKDQDDLVWYDMQPSPDGEANSYALSIDANKHGGVADGNKIICDVYAFDTAGNKNCLGRCVTEMTTKIGSPLHDMGNVMAKAYCQNRGWLDTAAEGETVGTVGQSLRMEALAVRSCIDGVGISLQGHVQKWGWMQTVNQDQAIGTMTQSLRLEAVRLTLTGENAGKYDICYRAHVQDVGWQGWVKDGAVAGTEGKGLRMEAVQIKIVGKEG